MQSIKYSVIVAICISILLPKASFAQKDDNWKEQFLNKLREPSDKTNIKKSSKEIDRTQEDELVRLMKYQAEAKDPGMATLLGGVFGFGLGHHYVSGRVNVFTVGEAGGLIAIVVGANMKEEKVWGEEEISGGGAILILLGAISFSVLRITEPFSAYNAAVEHNKKLLQKYNVDLSLSKPDKGFRLTYRF